MPIVNLKDFDFNVPEEPLDRSPEAAAWAQEQHKTRLKNTAHQALVEQRFKCELENGAISLPVGLMALISDLIRETPLKALPVPLAFQQEAPAEQDLPTDCRKLLYRPTRAWNIVDRNELTEKCKPIVSFIDLSEERRRRLSEKMVLFWNRSVRMEEEVKRVRSLKDPLIVRNELNKARLFAKEKEDEVKAAKAQLLMLHQILRQVYEQLKDSEVRNLEHLKERIEELDELHQQRQQLSCQYAELKDFERKTIRTAQQVAVCLQETKVEDSKLCKKVLYLLGHLQTPATMASSEKKKVRFKEPETPMREHSDKEVEAWNSAVLKIEEKRVRMGNITEFKANYDEAWRKEFLDLLLVKDSARNIAEQRQLGQYQFSQEQVNELLWLQKETLEDKIIRKHKVKAQFETEDSICKTVHRIMWSTATTDLNPVRNHIANGLGYSKEWSFPKMAMRVTNHVFKNKSHQEPDSVWHNCHRKSAPDRNWGFYCHPYDIDDAAGNYFHTLRVLCDMHVAEEHPYQDFGDHPIGYWDIDYLD